MSALLSSGKRNGNKPLIGGQPSTPGGTVGLGFVRSAGTGNQPGTDSPPELTREEKKLSLNPTRVTMVGEAAIRFGHKAKAGASLHNETLVEAGRDRSLMRNESETGGWYLLLRDSDKKYYRLPLEKTERGFQVRRVIREYNPQRIGRSVPVEFVLRK